MFVGNLLLNYNKIREMVYGIHGSTLCRVNLTRFYYEATKPKIRIAEQLLVRLHSRVSFKKKKVYNMY
jgi:hypothetical protein